MTFLLFVLIVLLLIVGWPMLRGWLYMRNLRSRINDTINETFGGGQQQQQQRDYSDYNTQRAATDKDDDGKIFDSTDGEYVEFEEVKGVRIEQTTTADDYTQTVVEEQIVDVEFEDIPA